MLIKRKKITLLAWVVLFWALTGGALLIYGHGYGHSVISMVRVTTVVLLGASLTFATLKRWPALAKIENSRALFALITASIGMALITALTANLITFFLLDRANTPLAAYAWDYLYFLLFFILSLLGWSTVAHQNSASSNYFSFRERGHLKRIGVDSIRYIKAEGDYVNLVLENEQLLYRSTIRALEQDLAELGFHRVHRGYLVNAAHVQNVRKGESLRHELNIDNGDTVPVSRSYADVAQALATL